MALLRLTGYTLTEIGFFCGFSLETARKILLLIEKDFDTGLVAYLTHAEARVYRKFVLTWRCCTCRKKLAPREKKRMDIYCDACMRARLRQQQNAFNAVRVRGRSAYRVRVTP